MAHTDVLLSTNALPKSLRSPAAFVVQWLPLGIVAALWELASGRIVDRAVLPSPVTVAGAVGDLIATGEIVPHLLVSLIRVAIGLGLSIAVGVALGIGMARSKPVEDVFDVFLTITYPIPKTALVPLAILWLGIGTGAAVLIVFLACLLPVVLNAYNAAGDVDRNLVWSARMMGTSERRVLWKVVAPATIPEIVTGIRQAIPIAFVALVSAELVASNRGIGHRILSAGQLGNYPRMFAAIVVISAVAYAAVRGFELLCDRVIGWT